jgi:hypothetical protein
MAYFDTIVLIHKCDDPVAGDLAGSGIPRREQVLQNLDYPLTERGLEILEDQMGVALAHRPLDGSRNVGPQHYVVQRCH